MHDVFEGICHYDLSHILNYYIENNFFSLEHFNQLKQSFSYGEAEVGNLCKEISKLDIKKKKFNTSARKMWTLIHYFPLMVGHLIPANDKVWSFVRHLIKMIDYSLLPKFNTQLIQKLRDLIEEHNMQYVELFHDTLKPKHHLQVHYPTIIEYSGPPKFFLCGVSRPNIKN